MIRKFVYIMLMAALLVPTIVVTAQSDTTSESAVPVEIIGVVTSVEGSVIIVNGVSVDISGIGITFEVGMTVQIIGILTDDNAIVADTAAVTDADPNESELIGVIETVAETTVTIGGQDVNIEDADIEVDIGVGTQVSVSAVRDDDGPGWDASSVNDSDDDPIEEGHLLIIGTITASSETSLQVGGTSIDVDDNTDVEADIIIGTRVAVEVETSDGGLTAIHVESHVSIAVGGTNVETFQSVDISIEGPVEAIDVNIVTIYGVDIEIDPDDPLLSVIQIDDVIHIDGSFEDDGDIVAVTVIFISVEVYVNVDLVWRDPGNCSNPPPDWAVANGWHRRCDRQGGGGGRPGGGGSGSGSSS